MRDNAFNGDGITVYGPNMNLVKDPRWGRSQEVYSEDPALTSALTMGYVTGIQGSTPNATQKDPKYMQAGACWCEPVAFCRFFLLHCPFSSSACWLIFGGRWIFGSKHYVAYDVEGGGGLPSRVYFDAKVDTRSFCKHTSNPRQTFIARDL